MFYFALFLLGILLTYTFWSPWDRAAIFVPTLGRWYDYFLVGGQFLTLFGLLSFAKIRLNVTGFFPRARLFIPIFLGVWFLINVLRGLLFGGVLSASGFAWLPTAYWLIAGFGILCLTVFASLSAGKGHTPAYFFLISLLLVFVCGVLLATYWWVEQGWPAGEPVIYILEAGFVFALLFLALGAGFRPVNSGE